MFQGKTDIRELYNEVKRQRAARKDLTAPVSYLTMFPGAAGANRPVLAVSGFGLPEMAMNETAHGQIAEYIGVPQKYYDRLRSSQPQLFAQTFNTLVREDAKGKRFVRTLDGNVRAFLSDRYRPLDNFELLEALLPVVMDMPGIRYASAEVTETNLYLKFVNTELEGEVKRGDVVRAGLMVSNSEVGKGSWRIAPFSERLVCTNGMVHSDLGQRRAHLGRSLDDTDAVREFVSDETRQAEDRAFYLKARDVIRGFLSAETLEKIVGQMREASEDAIPAGQASAVVESVAVHVGLNDGERQSMLDQLIEGADLSRWGVANAITRIAQDAPTYDRATELEAIGGTLLERRLSEFAPVPVKVKRRRAASPVAVLAGV